MVVKAAEVFEQFWAVIRLAMKPPQWVQEEISEDHMTSECQQDHERRVVARELCHEAQH